MLEQKEQDALTHRPSRLNRMGPFGTNWDDALRWVVQLPEDQGPVLNTYYQSIDPKLRPVAAAVIAVSSHRHCIRTPDATYLYAWLENAFTVLRKRLATDSNPDSHSNFGGRNTSVLSSWLRADPVLLRSLPFLVSSAFKRSGAYSHTPHDMAAILNATVPRHFRKKRFYPEFLSQVPTALIVGAAHLDERVCLLNMCEQQCRYAAGLNLQWRSVYPGSTIANDVNQLLRTMQALGTYTPSFLRSGLGLSTIPLCETALLPPNFDAA